MTKLDKDQIDIPFLSYLMKAGYDYTILRNGSGKPACITLRKAGEDTVQFSSEDWTVYALIGIEKVLANPKAKSRRRIPYDAEDYLGAN